MRYLLAVRSGRAGAIDSPYTRVALRRLTLYRPPRIAQCVEDQRTRDSTFAAFRPDELPPPKDD